MQKIPPKFYLQPTLTVAQKLIGCNLFTQIGGKLCGGIVVETEAYCGDVDRASHAYLNKLTKRTVAQFLAGGCSYIYLVYGLHYQFCAVTAAAGVPHVVLIRAIEPHTGLAVMCKRRGLDINKAVDQALSPTSLPILTNGPGKLTQALAINKTLNALSLTGDKVWFSFHKKYQAQQIVATTRIGIDYAQEAKFLPWRFYLKGNKFVSKK